MDQIISTDKEVTVTKAGRVIRAINHPLRKTILGCIKAAGAITVTKLYQELKLEQSVCSQHLAILRRENFLTTVREGKFIHYQVNQERIDQVVAVSEQLQF